LLGGNKLKLAQREVLADGQNPRRLATRCQSSQQRTAQQPDIRSALAQAKNAVAAHTLRPSGWLANVGGKAVDALAQASEALFATFERLTEHYEHSPQRWWLSGWSLRCTATSVENAEWCILSN
jgi:hypothetical protein